MNENPDYFTKYENLKMSRDEREVLEMQMHTAGGEFVFTGKAHTDFVQILFRLFSTSAVTATQLAKLPQLTLRYTRAAMTQRLKRLVLENVGYGLALEGISATNLRRQ